MATQPLFPTDEAWDDFITNELLTGNGTEWRLAERISSPEFNDDQRREIVTRLLTDEQRPRHDQHHVCTRGASATNPHLGRQQP